ncbi:dimethyl sulfoxide reductase anchor subunit family protein [Xenorhabdus sp. IM139775]|uniref:dimethyl sulfoxide reductase anchor subunit family protein n=1 Tax=Xenorhabdus sp. IM139775 TaxID=3025876 RepID=UPI002358F7C5|nr:DmsC/YnfH family molybdoenzyme membrane anchor subunit [Xenorhabdus sp. IM139775]MDC9594866.1 dimethyl sulfoxide reductase anchor subunit [Xenorhabdus sp. IM139775]
MSEWLLIAFTMLVQSSVGLVLMNGLYIYWLKHELNTWQHSVTIFVQKILLRTLLVSSALAGIGLAASLNIMGQPFNVYHALQNVNVIQEWVNIETRFAALYFGLLVLYTLFFVMKKHAHVYAMLVIGVIGLIDLHYMAIIYVNSAMITWANINTFFLFYSAVFTLGPALALLFIAYPLGKYLRGRLPIKLVMAALLVVFISVTMRLIEQPAYMEWLSEVTIVNANVIFPHQAEFNIKSAFGLRMLSWCLYIIAMAIWSYSLWKRRNSLLTHKNYAILIGAVLMFIAEMVNQYTFFIM